MTTAGTTAPPAGRPRVEALFLACYAAAVVGYLFLHPEPELWHWLTLVLVPLVIIARLGRYPGPTQLLHSLGLGPHLRGPGWPLAISLMVVLQGVQLLNGPQRTALVGILRAPWGPLLALLAAVLVLGTAATTEEVFFRGLLQTRLARATGSDLAALILATALFALYHIPYAYARPGSPTFGDFPLAIRAGLSNGLLGGLPLGVVFWRTRYNLVPAILLHAAIDLLPTLRWLGTHLGAPSS